MKPKTPRERAVETSAVRILLEERAWSLADLSRASGIDFGALQDYMATDFPFEPARLRVENALDRAIWSTPPEFLKAKLWRRLFGFDPRLASNPELRRMAKEQGFTGFRRFNQKRKLIEFISARLAVRKPPS